MAVIMDELEVVVPAEDTSSNDPTRPNGEPARGEARPLGPADILDLLRWEEERALRLRAH